jgi:hypothetical protein
MSIGLIIYIISNKGLLTIPGRLSKEEENNWDQLARWLERTG